MEREPGDKSVGIAVTLTLLFGPLGLLYATVLGGLIMMLATAVLETHTTYRSVTAITWLISVVWGFVEARRKHARYGAWLARRARDYPQA